MERDEIGRSLLGDSLASKDNDRMFTDVTESSFSEIADQNKQYVSFFSTVMNILNSLVGAEIMSIPNTMALGGVVGSVGLMTFVSTLSYIATIMVVKMQQHTHAESLNDLAGKIFGRVGSTILSSLTLLFTYSCLVAYLILGGNNIGSWFQLAGIPEWFTGWRRSLIMLIYSVILPVALTLPKKMTFLSSFSTFSIVCLFVFAVVSIYKSIDRLVKFGISPTSDTIHIDIHFFNMLAIFSLMFALPALILPILKPTRPGLRRRFQIVGTAFFCCYLFVLLPGILSYAAFGDECKAIILDNFPPSDILVQCIRASIFIVVTASFPVVSLSVTADLAALIFKAYDVNALPTKRRAIVLCCSNIPPVLIAMVCPKIQPVLEIGGALGGCLTNFFFPPALWFKNSTKRWYHPTNILCILFSAFGFVSAAIATYQAIYGLIHPRK